MKHLIVVLGPTGVGKTAFALRLAKHYSLPVVNADSRQIFAELPIGTAAPTAEQMSAVEHFFVGTRHIDDYYSASLYETEALELLSRLYETSELALMSGGSMMYIDAVCNGLDDIPTVDSDVRERCMDDLHNKGLDFLLDELRCCDPEYYAIVDKKNWRRVVHGVEICRQTGKTYTSFRRNMPHRRDFTPIKIGLDLPREQLYRRINDRVVEMMSHGFLEEARAVYPKRGLQSLNTVGYRELFDFFDGAITLPEAVEKIQSNTRRYMRKQLTWFKRDTEIRWFAPTDFDAIVQYIDNRKNPFYFEYSV